jgi:hypothetical protein
MGTERRRVILLGGRSKGRSKGFKEVRQDQFSSTNTYTYRFDTPGHTSSRSYYGTFNFAELFVLSLMT